MTFESSVLHNYKDFEAPEPVGLGDGHTVSAIGVGKVKVITQLHNDKRVVCWMTNVLYVPKLTNNLFSVNAATSTGNTVSFRQRLLHSKQEQEGHWYWIILGQAL